MSNPVTATYYSKPSFAQSVSYGYSSRPIIRTPLWDTYKSGTDNILSVYKYLYVSEYEQAVDIVALWAYGQDALGNVSEPKVASAYLIKDSLTEIKVLQ